MWYSVIKNTYILQIVISLVETAAAPWVWRVVPCLHFDQFVCVGQQHPKIKSQVRHETSGQTSCFTHRFCSKCAFRWATHSCVMSWFRNTSLTVSELFAGTNRWTWVSSLMYWGETGCHKAVWEEICFVMNHSRRQMSRGIKKSNYYLMLGGNILQDVNLFLRIQGDW